LTINYDHVILSAAKEQWPMIIAAGKFKSHCLKIMDDVHKNHREVVITKYGKPVAKLIGISGQSKYPLFGFLKGSVSVKGDIVSSLKEGWNADR
jgi:prevent-host-death family protein